MKKALTVYCIAFGGYALLITVYLLFLAPVGIPEEYVGTAADPATFMDEQQLKQSVTYSRIRSVLFFVLAPYEWGIYLFLLVYGLSRKFREIAEKIRSWKFIPVLLYTLMLSVFVYMLKLPFSIFSYRLAVSYGVSIQPWWSWFRDQMISLGIGVISTAFMIGIIFYMMNRSRKRWWLYTWFLSIPFSIFFYYAQPLIIDPLYHDFELLQDEALEEEVLALARSEGIPVDRVYVVNKSEKTNAINAYVNGVGSSLRIVLYDTALEKLEDDEILYIMAHEIGHYVMNHLPWSLFGNIMAILVGLYLLFILYKQIVQRWKISWRMKGEHDLALAPLLLLLISLLSFVSSPIFNGISRQAEQAADRFAVERTHNPEAAITTLQKLSLAGKSEINPPLLIKWFRYGHPTIFERIQYMRAWSSDGISNE